MSPQKDTPQKPQADPRAESQAEPQSAPTEPNASVPSAGVVCAHFPQPGDTHGSSSPLERGGGAGSFLPALAGAHFCRLVRHLNDEVPIDLRVQMGAGESDLDLDSLALTGLTFEMGAGRTTVDLTGDYKQDFDASIQGGVGQATVLLPSEVGVRARAQGGLGKINAEGLHREGDSYVNDAYGSSDVTLDVDVQGGVGEINLKVV